MRITVWNTAGALSRGVNDQAESILWQHLGTDVGLLQEAWVDPAHNVVGRPFDPDPASRSRWGSYVVAREGGPAVTPVERVPVGMAGGGLVEDSYPGATAVATVGSAQGPLSLVSVYGALIAIRCGTRWERCTG